MMQSSLTGSVRPFVRLSDACVVTKRNNRLSISQHHTKQGYISGFSPPTGVAGNCLFHPKYSPKVTHPFEKCRLRQISAYNVSTVRDSEKSSIMTNRKSTTSFPTSYRWSAYVTPKARNGWLKRRFFVLKNTGIGSVLYQKTRSSRYRRDSARCEKRPFKVTQGHPLLSQSTGHI